MTGTVELSETAINNLGIKTVKATIVPRATTIDVNGIVEFLPERQSHRQRTGRRAGVRNQRQGGRGSRKGQSL